MALPNTAYIITQDGLRGTADIPAGEGMTHSLVRLEDGRRLRVPVELLEIQADGSYYLSLDLNAAGRQDGSQNAQDETLVIPVVREELEVHKRSSNLGGVRVIKRVVEREELVDASGYQEEIEVERVPQNRLLDEPLSPYTEGDTLVIPLMEEVLVVEKRLILREEVRITRRQYPTGGQQPVTLRSEEVAIEPIGPEENPESGEIQ